MTLLLATACGFLGIALAYVKLMPLTLAPPSVAGLPWLEATVAALQVFWLLHSLGHPEQRMASTMRRPAGAPGLFVLMLSLCVAAVAIACAMPLMEQAVLVGMAMLIAASSSARAAPLPAVRRDLLASSVAAWALIGGTAATAILPRLTEPMPWTLALAGIVTLQVLMASILFLEQEACHGVQLKA